MRYVQSDPVIFTAGGLSSGIDLALHVVELYYGREITDETVQHLEYEGTGWSGSGAASVDFTKPLKPGLSATLDNLSNSTFENPSTEFSRKGETVEFSFAGDPAYKGTLTEDGNTIDGTLYMSDGSTANLKWTRSKALTDTGTIVAKNLPITGSWNGTLDVKGIRTNFVLHIQE
jgi:hypothetical protein